MVDKLKPNIIYYLIAVIFTGYLIARAIILPVTIDEGGTYFNAVVRSFWDIVSYADPSPNNHILNTLFIKFFVTLFGVSSFVLRLPNILAFLLYFYIIVIWLQRINNKPLFVLFGIVVLTCNPYLLDFFALARGYGLSISFMTWSLYLMYLYYVKIETKYLFYALIIAGLSVYSNFVLLHYFASLFFVLSLLLLQIHWNNMLRQFIRSIALLIFLTTLCILLWYVPMHKIVSTDQLKYWGTSGFFAETFIPLLDAMRYGNEFFMKVEIQIIGYFIIGLFLCFATLFLIEWRKLKFSISKQYYVFLFLIFIGTLLSILLQHYFFGIPFLNARGSVFLYVLFAFIIIFATNILYIKAGKSKNLYLLPYIGIGVFHLYSSINFYSCREWWFDADTKTVLNYIEENHANDKEKITLNTSWVFNASFQFHLIDETRFELAPFHHEIWPDSNYMYYYCEKADITALQEKYSVVKSYQYGDRVLMQKKLP